jgi:hypothetical protein
MYFFMDERENDVPVTCMHGHLKLKCWTMKVKPFGVGLYDTRINLITIRYTTLTVFSD